MEGRCNRPVSTHRGGKFRADETVNGLFELQVEKSPDAIAVTIEGCHLSYRELNIRANQVAHYLIELRVIPETLVGICVERSIEMVIGILGILKAGGAYLPLDPTYPDERLCLMLNDAKVSVFLIQKKIYQLLSHIAPIGSKFIHLDSDWEVISGGSRANPVGHVKSNNLAYVVYTSGSTGRPKGVMIEHRGICNVSEAQKQVFSLCPEDRILQFNSLSFDASTWEIMMALLSGARLCLSNPDTLIPGPGLIELLKQEKITVVTLGPTVLSALPHADLPSLHTVIVAGEACSANVVTKWADRRRFFNAYGPAESTIWATVYECRNVDSRPPPIGKPIANTRIHILDPQLSPLPAGLPAEIYIEGIGLARGYLNRPDLTAERFIPHPETQSRLYKTGDLGRYRLDGNIEFLGRVDHQVKIRGYRIELGDIETTLSQHPAIRDVVVLAREFSASDKRLVAYIVAEEGSTLSSKACRNFLVRKLPDFMIPAYFLFLDNLPLMPNGKVDRKVLPQPNLSRFLSTEDYISPRNYLENTLAKIWSEVLGVEHAGIHDNFFELGGDSILGIQIISRANQAGIKITPKQLFEHQSIAELAANTETESIHSEQGVVTGEVPLTPIQHWFFEDGLTDLYHFNQSVLVEANESIDLEHLKKVFQHLLKHHDALRLRFIRKDLSWHQVNAGCGDLAKIDLIDLSRLSEAEQRASFNSIATSVQSSLDLKKGPLLRVAVFNFGSGRNSRILIVVHHLAIDGVSWRIFLEDLQAAYMQLSKGKEIHLPPKTTSFKCWAESLVDYAQSEKLYQEMAYWLSLIEKPTARIPVDSTNGSNTRDTTNKERIVLSCEDTRALLQDVPKVYNSEINDVLLTALARACGRWKGLQAFLIDLEGHGREHVLDGINVSRTVGWFTAAFPVRLELEKYSNISTSMKSIREQLRSIPNHGIGFGLLRYLQKDNRIREQLREIPQPDVSFNYLGQFDQCFERSSLFFLTNEDRGPELSPRGIRRHLLEIEGIVIGGRLQFDFIYNTNFHRGSTIKQLAQYFKGSLQEILRTCQANEAEEAFSADFPLANLNQQQIRKVLKIIEDIDKNRRNRNLAV